MLIYRGDKFVKGKKFTINESVYRYQKRDNKDRLIFEGLDGKILKLTESEYDKILKEEANGYNEPSMIATVKAYYKEGNVMAKDMANLFVSTYAKDNKYPKLQAYVNELFNKRGK